MSTYDRLLTIKQHRGAGYLVLIDPDKSDDDHLPTFVREATEAGADGFLVGGSLLVTDQFEKTLQTVKHSTALPVLIFPGSLFQVSRTADAILFLVLISGRNPEHLIGNQVIAAPIIKRMALEAISTGYMLIESGTTTSAEFMSNTKPIPRNKPDIAVAHAIAAETIGMKMLYLDSGSGADSAITDEMITAIAKHSTLPMFIGGGIRTPDDARRKVAAGASFIVTGTATEQQQGRSLVKEFADAIHSAAGVKA